MKNKKRERLLEIMQAIDNSFVPKLNEEVSDNEWSFYSKNVDVNIEGIKEKFYPNADYVDDYNNKIDIKWHIVPELRIYGINGMNISIDKIIGTIFYLVVFPDENIPDKEDSFDVSNFEWKFIVSEINQKYGEALYPHEINLNLNTMECFVIF